MGNEGSAVNPLELSQQISGLRELVDQIRIELNRSRLTLPEAAGQAINQLSGSLAFCQQHATQYEDELHKLNALADIGQVVNSSLELEEVLRIVMDTIVRLIDAERGFLMLRDEANHNRQVMVIARNWEQESVLSTDYTISQTIVNRVIAEGQAVLTTNAQEDPRFGGQESIIAYNLRSILCVPLTLKDAVTGVIYADNRIRTGIFTEKERDLLASFANHAAIAIENARLFASVRHTLAEVTELKNLMDNVLSSIASGVITADVAEMITLCNRASESILGLRAVDIVGFPLSEALAPVVAELGTHLTEVHKTDQPVVGLELNTTLPKRGPVVLSLHLSPLKDAEQSTQGVAIVLDDLTEKKRLEAQRRLFERMVSPAVIRILDPDKLELGGSRVEITTLFADIRGYTAYSESRGPDQLVSVLNRYLSAAADAVLSQDGTIDKFLGDAIMALFNAPIPQADHTLRAVRAALDIREAVTSLHAQLPPELQLSFGVGIHFGDAVVGLIGTETRLDYTAIGDSVNTAKRIQENAMAGQILISEEAYTHVAGAVQARSVKPIIAKGKRLPVEVYEVLGISP